LHHVKGVRSGVLGLEELVALVPIHGHSKVHAR
jgi:hypothetical protein